MLGVSGADQRVDLGTATVTVGRLPECTISINDSNITERFTTTSDRVLDAVLDTNRRIVDAAVTTADRVGEQIRKQVTVELPFADRLPTPTVAGERYLDFVERVVSLNRDMNERVVDMIKADNAKKTPAKKTVAKKTVAKKTSPAKSPARETVAKSTSVAKSPAKRATATKRSVKKAVAEKAAASS